MSVMRLIGASALAAQPVLDELEAASFEGRVGLVWCDGQDVTGVFGDAGDDVASVLSMAAKVLPFSS